MPVRVLVDTSAWIEALRENGDPEIRAAVTRLTAEDRAVFCDLVLLELWNGARGTAEHRMLDDLERELECVPTSNEVWRSARELARTCRRKGLTIPATDLLIAACADHHDLALLHRDGHFDQLAQTKGDDEAL